MKPAIILSSHTIGLGPIRSLGSKGVPVIVVYYNRDDMGFVSKYVTRTILAPHPEKYEEKFLDILVDLAHEYGGGLLLPADDQTLLVVSRNKHILNQYYIVASTDWDISQKYLDKKYTYELAEKIGVPAPRTRVLNCMDSAERLGLEVEYPCILKPSVGHHYFEIFKQKMVRVENYDAMLAEFRLANEYNIEMMLQEYIPGNDTHGVNYNTYFWDGEPWAEFTAEKVRLSPPHFGVPRVLISKDIPEIKEPGSTFLKALGFYGYSCTEFKRDARTGQYKLMEVNGRVNLSTLHAVKCGIDFPWIIYNHLINGVLPERPSFKTNIYWIDSAKDIISSVNYYRQERYAPFDYIRPYLHPKAWAILSLTDPLPYLKRWTDVFRMGFSIMFSGKGSMEPQRGIYIEGNGCTKRMLELSTLRDYFVANGYEIVDDPEKAGTIILSTCIQGDKSRKHSFERLQMLKSLPAELIVYGCLSDLMAENLKNLPNTLHLAPGELYRIDELFSTDSSHPFESIPFALNISIKSRSVPVRHGIRATNRRTRWLHLFSGRTVRPRKKIPQGHIAHIIINSGCTGANPHCGMTESMGSVRSKHPDVLFQEIIRGIGEGYRTFVLLSDDIASYGMDFGISYLDLLSMLCKKAQSEIATPVTFYLENTNPGWLKSHSDELELLLATGIITGLTMQIGSGVDRLLSIMQSGYSQQDVKTLIDRFKKIKPDLHISARFVVGFPTETAQEHQESMMFIADMPFNQVELLPYCSSNDLTTEETAGTLTPRMIEKRVEDGIEYLQKNQIQIDRRKHITLSKG